ncbi:MAG: hypothetical protein ABI963_01425 [Rhizomicrobium sp.]
MTKTPDDISKNDAPTPSGKAAPVKPKPGPPVTKAERTARMRVDKMVIKRMRKR